LPLFTGGSKVGLINQAKAEVEFRKHISNISLFFGYASLYPPGALVFKFMTGEDLSNVNSFHIAYCFIALQIGLSLIWFSADLRRFNKPIKIFVD
jgi:hypothetical protein